MFCPQPDQIPKPVLFILPSDLPVYDLDPDKRRWATKNQVGGKGHGATLQPSKRLSAEHSRARQSVMWAGTEGNMKVRHP